MSNVFVTDLHLTDRDQDNYRWKIFDQLDTTGRTLKEPDLFILGDITEFKDYHPSRLVNRLCDALSDLSNNAFKTVHILAGNHDGLDASSPFFHFLRHMPRIKFYTSPTAMRLNNEAKALMLPHTRNPEKDWGTRKAWPNYDYIFMHGTVSGAKSETGHKMEGIPIEWFHGLKAKILSGDIHVPQKVGPVEYVGAPYPIRFGDSFQGRAVVLWDDGRQKDVPMANIAKRTLVLEGEPTAKAERALASDLHTGDHIKFIIRLSNAELGDWQKRKAWVTEFCREHDVELHKTQLERIAPKPDSKKPTPKLQQRTPEQALARYCTANKVEPELEHVGMTILKE